MVCNLNNIACILPATVAYIVAALIWVDIPESNEEVIYLIVGNLLGASSTAIAYWLVSSIGSASKDVRIAELASKSASK